VPTRTIERIDNQISEDNSVISFDDLSYDWAAATDPSYGGRLFYLVCNADYSAVPDDKNEAEKRQYTSLFVVTPQDFATNAVGEYSFNWVKFSFLDQDAEEETTAWIDPRIHHSLIIWIKYLTIAVENVEEEERVRARKELNRNTRNIRLKRRRHRFVVAPPL